MATLTVRNISDEALARFRIHAAEHGRSMEAEARKWLTAVAEGRAEMREGDDDPHFPARQADLDARVERVQARVREMFDGEVPSGQVDAFLAERRAAAERGE